MKTEIAELEIGQLKSEGLIFDYEFTHGNYINYLNLCIEKEGYDIKTIISKLKPNEKIIFSLNLGDTFNGSKDQKEGSIYWKHPQHGLCIRIQSSEKSLQDWSYELEKLFSSNPSDYVDVELPPFDDLDDEGNYIGTDPKFLKSFSNGNSLEG
jgi:N6-adenosine-specific RNA methylase IME4